jgi:hypothetical protein
LVLQGPVHDLAEISSVGLGLPEKQAAGRRKAIYYLVLKTGTGGSSAFLSATPPPFRRRSTRIRSKGPPLATGYDRDKQKTL